MAKIRNANPKNSSGGYERLFDNKALGDLIQKVQSTVISNGSELEKMIQSRANTIDDLDFFISKVNCHDVECGSYLASKNTIRESKYKLKDNEPDLVIFEIKSDQLNCYIIELKDGNVFDTKKSDAEHDHLKTYKAHLGSMIPFITNFFICCFNQLDKNIIVEGFKKRFSIEETMTGKELCDLLGISYEEIIEERKADAIDNVEYFVEELNKITAVRMMIKNIRNRRIDEESFYSDEIDIDQ